MVGAVGSSTAERHHVATHICIHPSTAAYAQLSIDPAKAILGQTIHTVIYTGRRKWGISAKQRWLQLTPSRTVRRTCPSFASQDVLQVVVPLVGDDPISWSCRSTMSIWCRAYCSHSPWFIRKVFVSCDQAKPLKPHWVLDRRFKLSFVQSWWTLQLKRRFSNIKLYIFTYIVVYNYVDD